MMRIRILSLDLKATVKLCRLATSVPSFIKRCDRRSLLLALCLSIALVGCTLNDAASPVGAPQAASKQAAQVTYAAALLAGVSFEAAHAMSGQAFILTSQEQLNSLYDQI